MFLIAILICITPASTLTREEAHEMIKKQMEEIAAGAALVFNSSKADENFLNTIDFTTILDKESRTELMMSEVEGVEPRKEYRCLSTDERNKYHRAMNFLKITRDPAYTMSKYDLIVRNHNSDVSPAAHGGPAFLPWHRQYSFLTESEYRLACPKCSMPYWDSRLERRLGGNPQESVLFSSKLAGTANGRVTDGFAANWLTPGLNCSKIGQFLTRNVTDNASLFMGDDIVKLIERARSLENISSPWNSDLEYIRGIVHIAVGGHMSDLLCSPSDPLFFMHHNFVDYWFQRWIDIMEYYNVPISYPDVFKVKAGLSGAMKVFNSARYRMLPFNIQNDYFIENPYDVRYETAPGDVKCKSDTDCCTNGNTEFIFCDKERSQCVSKVMEGGHARPNFPASQCHCSFGTSVIKSGICTCE